MRIASFSLLLCAMASAASAAEAAPHSPISFTVLRDGDPVGSHILSFQNEPDGTLHVTTDTNVVVKMAMIPIYRFEHHGRETWKDGHLLSLTSQTNDDGTHHTVQVSDDGPTLTVNGDGKTITLPVTTTPASLWNTSTVSQGTLLNTLDGHAMMVRTTDLGMDFVAVNGHKVPAHHYAMTGDLNRELWYDASGALVQVHFKAKDDSDIRYVLE